MKIVILTIGKTSTEYLRKGIEQYLERLTHYVPTELRQLPDVKGGKGLTQERQRELEGEQLLSALGGGDLFVLLDERGEEMTSTQFAGYIERVTSSGSYKRLVFAIGGPYGFSSAVYSRSDAKLSLSRMTLTHEMVRLLFVEQIYRAMTIIRGEKYHH